ncbi:hypothetical protein BV20DRAFT_1104072 [Pilatotrama ljubarskyi]|nr:hypothetical protein BV20DRAFT_1104072 [Pilatotrama ljubarskyi]
MHALCGANMSIHHHLARGMIREGTKWGEFWIAQEDDKLVGFMTWTPPGVEPALPKEQHAKLNSPFTEALSEEGKAYTRHAMGEVSPHFVAQCIGPKGKHDHWWLRTAMVRRGYQGRGIRVPGIARNLFEPRRCTRDSYRPSSLALITGGDIYKALGFELRGFRMVPSPWGEWPMYVFYHKPKL